MDSPERPTKQDTAKRRYEPPAIRTESVFETTALACGKAAGSAACTMKGLAS